MSSTHPPQPEVTVEDLGIMETKKRATRTYVPDGKQESHGYPTKKTIAPTSDGHLVTRIETRSSEASIGGYHTASALPMVPTRRTTASEVNFGRDMSRILSADVYHAKVFFTQAFQNLETPINFGVIVPGIYRCSYPRTVANFAFIRALSLKTIVSLVDDELPAGFLDFTTSNAIRHIVIGIKGTKKATISRETMRGILRVVLDQSHHPLLIHCNQGKHRTGCVAGVIKKACGWDSVKVVEEYISYATPKERAMDIAYLENFDLADLSELFEVTTLAAQAPHISPFTRVLAAVVVCLIIWYMTVRRIAEFVAPRPSRYSGPTARV